MMFYFSGLFAYQVMAQTMAVPVATDIIQAKSIIPGKLPVV
jgi:hypothetical protein